MKVRNGFVSNSSTSSFLIYGVQIEDLSDIEDVIEKLNLSEDAQDDRYEIAEALTKDTTLSYNCPFDYGVYIGKSWAEIEDDETGASFKKSIKKEIENIFGKEIAEKCETHSEAWHS